MTDLFIVVLFAFTALITKVLYYLDIFIAGLHNLLDLIFVDFFIFGLFFMLSKYKSFSCKYFLLGLVGIHFILLLNKNHFDDGKSPFTYYDIEFLRDATDTIITLIIISPLYTMLPIVLYFIFLEHLTKLFCQKAYTEH